MGGGGDGGLGKKLGGIGVVFLIGLLVIIYFVSGFYIICEVEFGVVLWFGEYNLLVEFGLCWKFIFVDLVILVDV